VRGCRYAIYSEEGCRVSSVEALAYEQSRRSIEQQAVVLNELRARTSSVLTAASLVASFLAAQAIARSGFGLLALVATLAFLGVLALCMSVLWPSRNMWRFRLRATPLLDDFDPSTGRTVADMYRHLAICMEAHWEQNQDALQPRFTRFQWACGALGAEVVLWTIHLSEGAT
jgi:hypothetical protein